MCVWMFIETYFKICFIFCHILISMLMPSQVKIKVTEWRVIMCHCFYETAVRLFGQHDHMRVGNRHALSYNTINGDNKYSGTSICRSCNDRFPACTVHHFWSRMKSHINNVIFSCIHRSPNYRFTALIVCKSRSWRGISRMDRLKKKLKWSNYLRYLSLDYKSGNTLMQSRFTRGFQLRVRVISVISELYFVESDSVLSRVIYSIWFICFH